ncbi:MAG: hypothetical protein LV481_12245 [Methylacidiphilales bacterium]|nr:hypothetical protein [Candidatus Methylacidiphilales bacterium]
MSSAIFKPWLVLVLIFLAGVGTGILLTVGLGSHFKHPPGAQIMKRHWMAYLTEKLNLTADQQAKIEPIVTDAATRLQALHHDEMTQASRIMDLVNSQISALLTPDQNTKLQQLKSERDREFPGRPHPWMRPGGPPPGMGGQGEPAGSPPPPPPQLRGNSRACLHKFIGSEGLIPFELWP